MLSSTTTESILEDAIEKFKSRSAYTIEQIDQVRHNVTQLQTLLPRLEATEARCVDIRQLCQQIKESVPPSAEHIVRDLKDIKASIQEFKGDNLMELDELKAEIQHMNESRELAELEERLRRRQNDVVKALTQ